MTHNVLCVMSAWCDACHLYMIAAWALERMYWRQFLAQWRDCKKISKCAFLCDHYHRYPSFLLLYAKVHKDLHCGEVIIMNLCIIFLKSIKYSINLYKPMQIAAKTVVYCEIICFGFTALESGDQVYHTRLTVSLLCCSWMHIQIGQNCPKLIQWVSKQRIIETGIQFRYCPLELLSQKCNTRVKQFRHNEIFSKCKCWQIWILLISVVWWVWTLNSDVWWSDNHWTLMPLEDGCPLVSLNTESSGQEDTRKKH